MLAGEGKVAKVAELKHSPTSPSVLGEELEVPGKFIRTILRKKYPRQGSKAGCLWTLTPQQITEVKSLVLSKLESRTRPNRGERSNGLDRLLGYDIHHLNRNPMDNDIDNLVLIPEEVHSRLHHPTREVQKEVREVYKSLELGIEVRALQLASTEALEYIVLSSSLAKDVIRKANLLVLMPKEPGVMGKEIYSQRRRLIDE